MHLPLGAQAAAGLPLSTAEGSFWADLRSGWASRAKITYAWRREPDEVGRYEGKVGVFNPPWIGRSVSYLSDTVLLCDLWSGCWEVWLPVCNKNLPSILRWVQSAQICHSNDRQGIANTPPVRKQCGLNTWNRIMIKLWMLIHLQCTVEKCFTIFTSLVLLL